MALVLPIYEFLFAKSDRFTLQNDKPMDFHTIANDYASFNWKQIARFLVDEDRM